MNDRRLVLRQAVAVLCSAAGQVSGVNASQPFGKPELGCYARYSIKLPPAPRQTVVLVDQTTAPGGDAYQSFERAVASAAAQPGQRLVLLTFAGFSATEHVRTLFDAVLEARERDPDFVENQVIRALRRSELCLRDAHQAWPANVRRALDSARPPVDNAMYQRSQIVDALRFAIRNFTKATTDTRILVWSDGLEHAEGGLSFYGRDQRPRMINATEELAKLGPAASQRPASDMGALSVYWWGLLAGADAAPKTRQSRQFLSADTEHQLRSFWTALLRGWGARDVRVERDMPSHSLG